MSDNEIIKTLECCQSNSCNGCPFEGYNVCLRGLPRVAIDLIKRQKVEIEGLKIANEHMYAAFKQLTAWISVEERLPDDHNERVLVKIKDCYNIIGHPDIDTDRYAVDSWVRWGENVTHWMPLPEPPKGE